MGITTEEFIKRAKAVHGEKYGYSKTEYIKAKNKIIVTCKKHGDWMVTPDSHMRGRGCPTCGAIRTALSKQSNGDEFIYKATAIYGDKYDYSQVHYVKSSLKVKIICPEHGGWETTPNSFLKGHECRSCGIFKKELARREKILKRKFKNIVQPEDYKLIPLGNGRVTLVSNEDFERVRGYNWHFNGNYASSNDVEHLHRYIMNPPEGMVVDHKNGVNSRLDNRRENLRICTPAQNSWNTPPRKGASNYKGVTLSKGKWVARITVNKKKYSLGAFEKEEEAALAYNEASIKYHGEFGYLNIID